MKVTFSTVNKIILKDDHFELLHSNFTKKSTFKYQADNIKMLLDLNQYMTTYKDNKDVNTN